MRLEGKSAVVTGGGRGIGRAVCEALAREGCRVLVCDINVGDAEDVVRSIKGAGGEASQRLLDVTSEDDIAAAVREAAENFGRLDIMVNNAGISGQSWQRTLDVNLSGVYYGCIHAAETMARAAGGSIINTASILGLVGIGGATAYVAAKHGVVGLTQDLAVVYGRQNVRINAVCPGWVDTDMTRGVSENEALKRNLVARTPLGRFARPEEIAPAFVFLASDEASYVTGSALAIDGGWVAQ